MIEIDLSQLQPHVVGPHTPDLARPVSDLAAEAAEKKYPLNMTAALIGSCTNSSYEDISRAADIARQAAAAGATAKARLFISPGSEQIFETSSETARWPIWKKSVPWYWPMPAAPV